MRYRTIGQTDLSASVIAFGAWAIGGWRWGGTDINASVAAIRAALDGGVNFIDTAAVYGFGLSEELVGRAIKDRRRDELILATKCGLRWDIQTETLHASSDDNHKIYRCLRPESIRWELEQSLNRLGTDYIDLYQPHWQDPATPTADVMGTLLALKDEGKIRAIGICNASVEMLAEYRAVGRLDCDQERYSLLDRGQETANLPFCAEHNMAFLAYSPLAQGLLTGKIDAEREFPSDDIRHNNPRFSRENRKRVNALLAQLRPLAETKESPVEHLVLAWTLARPGLSHVLVGARNAGHGASNARAGVVTLSAEELAVIDQAAAEFGGLA